MGTAQVLIASAQAQAYFAPPRARRPYARAGTPWRGDQIACHSFGLIQASMGIACSGAPEPAAPQTPRSRPRGGAEGAPGLHSPGRSAGSRGRFRPRADPEAAPPPRPAPPSAPPGARARPPTWLSPTQKTRPPRLRHTRAPRGCAAARQKVKEQCEARSCCTVVRTSAAGPRPQRAHRYR